MKNTTKPPFSNQLANIRRSKRIEQEQVAALLGHRGTDQVSRYEEGVQIPNLKTALKLAQIYKIPVRIMLDGYFEACRVEIQRQEALLSVSKRRNDVAAGEFDEFDYCTYEQKLAERSLPEKEITKVRRHSTFLVRKTAERLGHF